MCHDGLQVDCSCLLVFFFQVNINGMLFCEIYSFFPHRSSVARYLQNSLCRRKKTLRILEKEPGTIRSLELHIGDLGVGRVQRRTVYLGFQYLALCYFKRATALRGAACTLFRPAHHHYSQT